MSDNKPLENMAEEIQKIRNSAELLREMGKGIETAECYVARILSGIRILGMNITDVAKIIEQHN